MRIFAVILLWCALPALAGQTAYTVRSSEIKKEPFSDAATLATLPEKSQVTVLTRQAGWMKIEAGKGITGWMRMLSLRLGTVEPQQGDSGLQSLLNVARSGTSGTTVTTGVRGLSDEDLKTARSNPRELEKLKNFSVPEQEVRQFAAAAKLAPQTVAYMPATAPTGAEKKSLPW